MAASRNTVGISTMISIAATITSVCALALSIYQAKLSNEERLKSVWPYLITYESLDLRQQSSMQVVNYGIGPAIIDSVRLLYKGQLYDSPVQVANAIAVSLGRKPYSMPVSHSQISKGMVIPPQQTVAWFTVTDSVDNAIFRNELPQIRSRIYYHSIYDQRWHSGLHEGNDPVVEK